MQVKDSALQKWSEAQQRSESHVEVSCRTLEYRSSETEVVFVAGDTPCTVGNLLVLKV